MPHLLQYGALILMGIGVYLTPPEYRGIAIVLAAGFYFNTPFQRLDR